jgi:hypothetical protein
MISIVMPFKAQRLDLGLCDWLDRLPSPVAISFVP